MALALAVSGCGGGTTEGVGGSAPHPSGSPNAAGFPVTVKAADGPVRIPQRPERIVSLSPTATEMLFAIGAGPQVVAVDQLSDYPADAPRTKLSGGEPNVEAIAGYHPDLVVIANDVQGLVRSLEKVSIPVLLEPAAHDLDDSYAQIEQLGAATGQVAEAAQLVASMRSRIDELVASAPRSSHRLSYYHELDQTYYTATSKTFIGQVYALLGLRNIADRAKGAGSDYPQLSAEYVIRSDPDVIFLADTRCCGQSPRTVAHRPGWKQITAVRNGAVFALDDDIASRWGPRVVDYLQVVVRDLSRLREPAHP